MRSRGLLFSNEHLVRPLCRLRIHLLPRLAFVADSIRGEDCMLWLILDIAQVVTRCNVFLRAKVKLSITGENVMTSISTSGFCTADGLPMNRAISIELNTGSILPIFWAEPTELWCVVVSCKVCSHHRRLDHRRCYAGLGFVNQLHLFHWLNFYLFLRVRVAVAADWIDRLK